MDIALDSSLSQRLGRIFELKSGATELALAGSDREQLGAALLRSLVGASGCLDQDRRGVAPACRHSRDDALCAYGTGNRARCSLGVGY